ncbi:hypothetical protein NE237_029633 [Protea cynaroides]|uniref:Uncharacterized protein n=1 Tax=Protea cynaroides TaxID=273540 RepID=A0A9Q0JUZ9_9MAGN|nr:hypothetical protein NE237_029633 [Protea cynaroides]
MGKNTSQSSVHLCLEMVLEMSSTDASNVESYSPEQLTDKVTVTSNYFLNTFALHGITKPNNGDSAALVHLGRQPSWVSLVAVPEKDPMNAGRLIDAQKLVIHQKIVRIPRGRGISGGKTPRGRGYVGGHTSKSDASVALISSPHYLWFIVTSLVYLNFL